MVLDDLMNQFLLAYRVDPLVRGLHYQFTMSVYQMHLLLGVSINDMAGTQFSCIIPNRAAFFFWN